MVNCRINLNTVLVDKVVNRVSDPVHFLGPNPESLFKRDKVRILTVKLKLNQF
jgi:hypothetical protein